MNKTYYLIKNLENGKYLTKYIDIFKAKDLTNANIFSNKTNAIKKLRELKNNNLILINFTITLSE